MNTRARIIETALGLFNEYGNGEISTNHIAQALGISPGNLYYHFRNKEEIIRAIAEQKDARWESLYHLPQDRTPTLADVERLVRENFALVWDYRFFFRELSALTQRDPLLKAHYQQLRRERLAAFKGLFAQFVSAGVLPHSVVDNSAFPPTRLTIRLNPAYSSFQELSMLFISSDEDRMAFQVFLLLCFLMLSPLVALSSVCAPSWPSSLGSTRGTLPGPPSAQAAYPTRLSGLPPFLPHLTGCRTIAFVYSPLARGEKPSRCSQTHRHARLCLSSLRVSLLRYHRRSPPCSRWGWQAWLC